MRRRKKALKTGRVVPILIAAGVGYLIGSWNAAAMRSGDGAGTQTAAAMVALRFPQAMNDTTAVQAADYEHAAATNTAMTMQRAQLALFEPEPMLPGSARPASAAAAPAQAMVVDAAVPDAVAPDAAAPKVASEPPPMETADISPTPAMPQAPEVAAPILPKPSQPAIAALPHPAPVHHQAKRPGYMLSDAQIADIKRRLRLTPDQEQMWPAVASALRNIGAQGEREARWRGASAAIDPDSPQVQDLKSAAIPLLMSFSDEQKDEVRDLAHHMGLDQLASEF
jgi:hypothetical protein